MSFLVWMIVSSVVELAMLGSCLHMYDRPRKRAAMITWTMTLIGALFLCIGALSGANAITVFAALNLLAAAAMLLRVIYIHLPGFDPAL